MLGQVQHPVFHVRQPLFKGFHLLVELGVQIPKELDLLVHPLQLLLHPRHVYICWHLMVLHLCTLSDRRNTPTPWVLGHPEQLLMVISMWLPACFQRPQSLVNA